MLITRAKIKANIQAQREMQRLVPRFRVSPDEMRRKAHDDLFAPFAWPGGYQVVFVDEEGDYLCRDCAITHVYGYDVTDENESPREAKQVIEKTHTVLSEVYWEGPDEPCAACRTMLQAAYGDPDKETTDDGDAPENA